jgi:hypothetical protein
VPVLTCAGSMPAQELLQTMMMEDECRVSSVDVPLKYDKVTFTRLDEDDLPYDAADEDKSFEGGEVLG